jgi:hypothetical protein
MHHCKFVGPKSATRPSPTNVQFYSMVPLYPSARRVEVLPNRIS